MDVNDQFLVSVDELYGFDMFKQLPKRGATVGALRAQATDVDLGFRSAQRLKKSGTDTVTVLDLATNLPTAASGPAEPR